MDRKWSALLISATAAVTFIQSAAPEAFFAPFREGVNGQTLARLVLSMELGSPAMWLPNAGESPEPAEPEGTSPGGDPASPPPEETAELTPAPISPEPTPRDAHESTAEPVSEPPEPEEDEPAPTPEPLPEIRDFTDTPGVAVKNNTGFTPDIAALLAEGPSQRLSAGGPQILIIHTHSTEAYQ